MLQSIESQRVGHDLATEQQQMVVLFLILGGTFHTVFHSGYTLTFKKDLEFKHKSYLELAVCPVGTEVFWRQLVITTVLQTVRSDPLRASETLPILTA